MTRSWPIRGVAGLMLGYGLLTLHSLLTYHSLWFLLWVVPCFVAVGGLLFSRTWSRYLVYLIASSTILGWAVFIAIYASRGLAPQYLIRLLVLGAVLIVLFGWSCLVVRRHFKAHA